MFRRGTERVSKTFQVQFTLDFPDGKEDPNAFTVEMASLKGMLNAVFTFPFDG